MSRTIRTALPSAAPDPSQDEAAMLRKMVLSFRLQQRLRVFETQVHVGCRGQRATTCEVSAKTSLDHALRSDIVGTLLDQVDRPSMAWITRSGRNEAHDCDLAWLSATRAAFLEAELELHRFVVVTRYGWLDPSRGTSRTWRRLRSR